MKLFKLITKNREYYVVASTTTDADVILQGLFQQADTYSSEHRKVLTYQVLAEEIYCFPEGNPFFKDEPQLILPSSCKDLTKQAL